MVLKLLKSILNKLEIFSIDTQLVRDILSEFQQGNSKYEKALETLKALNNILDEDKSYIDDVPVHMLLNQLRKIKDKEENLDDNNYVNNDLLKILVDIKSDINELKNKESTIVTTNYDNNYQPASTKSKNSVELNSVFVKPEIREDNLKTNIKIEAKEGNNVLDKLQKLRKFKK